MFFRRPLRGGILTQMALSYLWFTVASLIVLQVLGFIVNGFSPGQFYAQVLRTGLIALLVIGPFGALFGLLTTGPYVKRVSNLVLATERFANGDYSHRVPVIHATDEVGLLEQQFNRMAEQLVETIAQQKKLAEQNARMQERARISRELHDAISQDLFSMRTLAHGLHAAVLAGAPAGELELPITLLEQAAVTMSREMRALLLEMRPPQLEGLCFMDALAALADTYTSRLGIAVTTAISPVAISSNAETALLRITQEAFTNSARHSNASLIHLELAARGDSAILSVSDNGQGFDPTGNGQPSGLGLQTMQERVNELGGTFSLESASGRGTRIEVQVPQEKTDDPSRYCR